MNDLKKMGMSVRLIGLLLIGLMVMVSTPTLAGAPDQLVKRTADKVLAKVMANKTELKSNSTRLYSLVNSYVLPHFDFVKMSKSVLGKHWRKATKSQQSAFVKGFRKMLVRTYAKALLEYSGQSIEYRPAVMKGAKKAVVKTKVQGGGGPALPIDYLLHKGSGRWKVIDIKVNGISLLSNYRTSYGSQVRKVGVAGLIKKMQGRR